LVATVNFNKEYGPRYEGHFRIFVYDFITVTKKIYNTNDIPEY